MTIAGCGSDSEGTTTAPAVDATAGSDPAATELPAAGSDADGSAPTELADGPVTVVALGDSLTAAVGDETGQGFVGLLTAAIDAAPGRSGSSLSNYGVSGWHSTGMVDGQDGAEPQLAPAVVEVEATVAAGRAVLATILIGSNDLWYLYEGEGDQDAAAEIFRTNLDRAVGELTQAGAVVVVGLPDDQSLRPLSGDLDLLHGFFANITADEIRLMSAMSYRLGDIVDEVAAQYGARTVDTNSPFWADTATMDEDLGHPNEAGYAILADLWITAVRDLL
jgi:lysophospholipase L1-like esterase